MNDLFLTMRSRSVSSIAVGLVLIALCFSVGEGLRLTPFPVSQQVQKAVYKHGPLDVPTQSQKRGKRFAVEFSCPVSAYAKEIYTRRYCDSEPNSIAVAASLPVAFTSDRAPPLTA